MPHIKTPKATNIAANFLTRCFATGETIALCLRRENPAGILQRKVPLERAIALTAQRMTARRKIA